MIDVSGITLDDDGNTIGTVVLAGHSNEDRAER